MRTERKSKRLWVINTSRYPMAEVWPLCMAALDSMARSSTMPPIIVKLTNTYHAYRGRGGWTVRHEGVIWKRVLVRIGGPQHYKTPISVRYPRFKGDMPEHEVRSYREAIVMVAAHEMEHALGTSGRKGGEFKCELSASDGVDYYRANQVEIDRVISAGLILSAARSAPKAKPTPDQTKAAKLAASEAMLAKWKRKFTIAKNKVRKYERAVKRQRNLPIAFPAQAEPVALAAKGPCEQT